MILLILFLFVILYFWKTRHTSYREFSCKFSGHSRYDDNRYVDIDAPVPYRFKDFYKKYENGARQVGVGKDNKKFYVNDRNGIIHCITDENKEFEYTPKIAKCKGAFADIFTDESIPAFRDSDGSVHLNVKQYKFKIGNDHDRIIRLLDAYKCNKDGIEKWFETYKDYTISWVALNKDIITIYYR